MWGRWRRRRRLGRVRPGDGSLLEPFGGWDVLTRSLFYLELPDADPEDRIWAVDVHHFAEEDSAELYRGRRQSHRSTLPAGQRMGRTGGDPRAARRPGRRASPGRGHDQPHGPRRRRGRDLHLADHASGVADTTLVVAGVLAGLERALMLRNHWLIDADTWWMDD